MGNTKRDTGRVLGIKNNAQAFTVRSEEISPPQGFGQTVSFAVLLLQDVTPKNARCRDHTQLGHKDQNEGINRANRDTPIGQFCAVDLAFETTIREESPAGKLKASHSGRNSGKSNMENFFSAWATKKLQV